MQRVWFNARRAGRRGRGRVALGIASAALLGVGPAAGCYSYVPTAGAPVPAGARVRVQLSDAGSTSLGSYLGADVVSVTGRMLPATDDSVVNVAMASTQLTQGRERYWNGEAVTVPRRFVATVRRQQFSGTRTALLSAGLGALAYALYAGLGGVGGGNSSPSHSGTGGPK